MTRLPLTAAARSVLIKAKLYRAKASREQQGEKILPNEELATAIRQVKSGKEYHFALIAKSGARQLALDKRKVSD